MRLGVTFRAQIGASRAGAWSLIRHPAGRLDGSGYRVTVLAVSALFLRLHRGVTRTSAVALIYTVIAVGATWPLAAHLGNRLASDLGDPAFNAWVIGWDA